MLSQYIDTVVLVRRWALGLKRSRSSNPQRFFFGFPVEAWL